MKNYTQATKNILSHAKEFLRANTSMTIPQLKEYVREQTGEEFSNSCYSVVPRLVKLPEYSRLKRGIYTRNLNEAANSNPSMYDEMANVIDNSIKRIKRLTKTNILDISEERFEKYIEDVKKLREKVRLLEIAKEGFRSMIPPKIEEPV